MKRRTPRSTLTDTLFPDTTLVRSVRPVSQRCDYRGGPSARSGQSCILGGRLRNAIKRRRFRRTTGDQRSYANNRRRSEEHTSELQSLMRISYAVFCLKTKINKYKHRISYYNLIYI